MKQADVLQSADRGWLAEALQPGFVAIRKYWMAFLAIQVCALLLVVGYFSVPVVNRVCGELMQLRQWGGLWVAAAVSAVAGGLLPELFKWGIGIRVKLTGKYAAYLAYNSGFFFVNGLCVDLSYTWQSMFWGSGGLEVALAKMAVDQFLFTPFYFLPSGALAFTWRDFGFSGRRLREDLKAGWYRRRVLPALLPCWCYWIPMTLMIFSLPRDLQLCLFAFALAAWNLVAVYVLSAEEGRNAGHA